MSTSARMRSGSAAPTAGFIDPFLAGTLGHELRIAGALAWRLIDAVTGDEFGSPRFKEVAALDREIRAAAGLADETLLDSLADPRLSRISAGLATWYARSALPEVRDLDIDAREPLGGRL